ncbi:MAG: hypothetical protein K6F41_04790, partial [Lachnospira sp.]|nr:hypothetical protein [Lachnospira sp.]
VEVLDGKKYVTDVDLFLKLRVDYYEYKGPFLKGNTKKISAFYEPACPDPYANSYKGKVVYYYYDNDGNPVEEKESYY